MAEHRKTREIIEKSAGKNERKKRKNEKQTASCAEVLSACKEQYPAGGCLFLYGESFTPDRSAGLCGYP